MLRKVRCGYCVKLFQPSRVGHQYCSDTCRKLQFKAKKAAENRAKTSRRLSKKLQRLSSSSFGKYLVRELKRAGTVQILKGHNSASLTELVALKRRCTVSAGFDNGESLGAYELSHIYPVGSVKSKSVGLLNCKNLTITPKEFNRKHSTKLPSCGYQGQHLSRGELESRWAVSVTSSSLDALLLARKYVGNDFDNWLSKHTVNPTQKQALIRQLTKAGFDGQKLKEFTLEQLRSMAADEDIAYFNMSKSPEDVIRVLIEELSRLKIGGDFQKAFEYLDIEDWDVFYHVEMKFAGTTQEREAFKEFLIEQSLACLHGQPYLNKWKKKIVLDWFKRVESVDASAPKPYQDEEGDWTV